MQNNETITINVNLEQLTGNKVFTAAKDGKKYICIESQNLKTEEYQGQLSYKYWLDVNLKKDTTDKVAVKIAYNKDLKDQKIYVGNGSIKTFGQQTSQQPSQQAHWQAAAEDVYGVQPEDDGLPF
jgi:hypothetical protein